MIGPVMIGPLRMNACLLGLDHASRDFQSPPVAAPTQILRSSRGDTAIAATRPDVPGGPIGRATSPWNTLSTRHLGRSAQPVLRGDTGRCHCDGERVTGCVRAGVRARRERDRRLIRSTGRIGSAIIATMSPVESWLGLPAAEATARVLERTRAYVELETPSGDATRLCRLASLIEAELTTVGSAVEPVDAPGRGRNLRATIEGAEIALAPLVVLAHIDTVHPLGTLERQPYRVENGRAEGPGIYDMKTSVALVIEALDILARRGARPRRPVRFLVTCDEEIGSHSSRPLMADAARGAAAALVPEPCMPDGSVKTERKGVLTFRIDVRGKAGHAGTDPGVGASAITEMAHQILHTVGLADIAKGTTVNVGTLQGGTASNVVAAEATATVDVRIAHPAEGDRIRAALAALRPHGAGTRVTAELTESRGPLERTDAVLALYHQARAIAAELGVELGEGATGGGSDGSIIAEHGVPVLDGLGPRGGGAHAADEHILVEDLPFRLALIGRLLETL